VGWGEIGELIGLLVEDRVWWFGVGYGWGVTVAMAVMGR